MNPFDSNKLLLYIGYAFMMLLGFLVLAGLFNFFYSS
ncbi:UNVERIFIED_CONTAM: hypothetical protein ABID98_003570 [Brevibacillus sp. OAP136]